MGLKINLDNRTEFVPNLIDTSKVQLECHDPVATDPGSDFVFRAYGLLTSLLRARRLSFGGGFLSLRPIAEQRQGIHGATRRLVDTEMKMRWRAGGIAGGANVAEQRLCSDIFAFRQVRRVGIEVRVIINPAAGADH